MYIIAHTHSHASRCAIDMGLIDARQAGLWIHIRYDFAGPKISVQPIEGCFRVNGVVHVLLRGFRCRRAVWMQGF